MKLGISLTIYLVGAVFCTMVVFGYLSIQQDRENLVRELRLGMAGFSEAVQEGLGDIFADQGDLPATQDFIDRLGPSENIHSIIVYDPAGKPVAQSPSVEDAQIFSGVDIQKVAATGKRIDGLITHEGELIYYRAEPIVSSRYTLTGVFLLARQGGEFAEVVKTRRNHIIVTTGVIILLVCLLIFAIVQRKISRPISELIVHIRALGTGRWERPLDISGHDEVSVLAKEFNRMSERLRDAHARLIQEQEEKLQLERNLRHSEKLASVGQLAAGLAHEIGTPLNIIGGRAEHLLRRQRTSAEVNDNLQIIRSQIDRITGIVRQLLEFSRRREPHLREVDVPSLLNNVKTLFQHKTEEKQVVVRHVLPETLPMISADADLLQQVFINLYQNSLQAMGPGGTIEVKAEVAPDGQSPAGNEPRLHRLRIRFEDNGRGISPQDIGRVFEPFFTTKDVGEGTGLGLALTYGIIKEHRGEIHVESTPGQFTRFIIELPIEPMEYRINGGGK
ncbi:MAG TPA: ATP-binding protein [Candidatus Binatia bacterium]